MYVRVCARTSLPTFSYNKHVVLIACQVWNIRVCLTFCKTIFPIRFIFCTVALNTNRQFHVRRSCVGSQNIPAIEKTLIVFASCALCVPHVLNRWKCRRCECLWSVTKVALTWRVKPMNSSHQPMRVTNTHTHSLSLCSFLSLSLSVCLPLLFSLSLSLSGSLSLSFSPTPSLSLSPSRLLSFSFSVSVLLSLTLSLCLSLFRRTRRGDCNSNTWRQCFVRERLVAVCCSALQCAGPVSKKSAVNIGDFNQKYTELIVSLKTLLHQVDLRRAMNCNCQDPQNRWHLHTSWQNAAPGMDRSDEINYYCRFVWWDSAVPYR